MLVCRGSWLIWWKSTQSCCKFHLWLSCRSETISLLGKRTFADEQHQQQQSLSCTRSLRGLSLIICDGDVCVFGGLCLRRDISNAHFKWLPETIFLMLRLTRKIYHVRPLLESVRMMMRLGNLEKSHSSYVWAASTILMGPTYLNLNMERRLQKGLNPPNWNDLEKYCIQDASSNKAAWFTSNAMKYTHSSSCARQLTF